MAQTGLHLLRARYAELEREADPLADDTARAIVATGKGPGTVNELFERLVRNDDFSPDTARTLVGAEVVGYLERSRSLPQWASPSEVAVGERVYSRYGPECMTALLFKSLPAGYTHWHVAETLAITGRMREERVGDLRLTRRILETLQFVIYVMEPGGIYDPSKRGVASIQKVRLIHATIRGFIKQDPRWDAKWPEPLNQVELVMTMLTFSLLVLDGLEQVGVELTSEEREGVLYLWKVVGSMMGIREDLLPQDLAEARAMWALIDERARAESEAAKALTRALIYYGKTIVPFAFLRFAPALLIRFYCGRDIAVMLGIRSRFNLLQWLALELVRLGVIAVSWLARHWPWFRLRLRRFHLSLLKGLLGHWNEQYWHARKQVGFYLPVSLTQDWQMPLVELRPARARAGAAPDEEGR